MISSVIVVVLAVVIVFSAIGTAAAFRARSRKVSENPSRRLRAVDVEAFRNLIDPAEEEFLRSRLPAADFRRIQRERLGAAVEYISGAASNAAVLLRLAETARHSSDPGTVECAEKLIEEATRLRLYAFQAIPRLYLAMLFPSRRTSPVRIAESYEQMTQQVVSLGLQYPTRGISGAL